VSSVTVDASVWVAVADPTDVFSGPSRAFLEATVARGDRVVVPAFALVEVACVLARKYRDPLLGRQLAQQTLSADQVELVPVDEQILALALNQGTDGLLRGADALYAATAHLTGTSLISWDNELIRRAGAVSPTDWLNANP